MQIDVIVGRVNVVSSKSIRSRHVEIVEIVTEIFNVIVNVIVINVHINRIKDIL